MIFLEYAVDTAIACHERGLKTVAVTAGYICPEPRSEFFSHMDAANIDLKGFTEEFYHDLCAGSLSPILETLIYLRHETDVWFETTTLLIPGQNDSDDELKRLADWIAENLGPHVPLHFSAFHPDYRMQDISATPHQTLLRAHDISRTAGLHHVYVGNVHDKDASSKYCTACGELLIGRDWHQLAEWGLDDAGTCKACGHLCAGVFKDLPGDWGRRRQLVRIS